MLRKLWPAWVDWALLVGWMAVIFYFSAQPHIAVPGIEIVVIRKGLHMSEFLLLFLLWCRALCHTLNGDLRQMVRVALLLTIAYAISDELHQLFVPDRDGNALDVLIDSALPLCGWLTLEARQK